MHPQILKAHSILGASSYKRWKKCSKAPTFCLDLPKVESKYAAEGTRAHEVGEILLNKKQPDYPVLEEMLSAVKVYVDYVETLRAQKPDFESVEQRFDLSEYFEGLFGTCDYVCYFAKTKTLYVVDYKHGAGLPVEVEKNEQLQYYAIGALHKNKFPIKTINIVIVQPRCYHEDGPIREWSTTPSEILDYLADLITDAEITMSDEAVFYPSEETCRFCPAAEPDPDTGHPYCPAIKTKTMEAVKRAFEPIVNFDQSKTSEMLKIVPVVESWCKAIREWAYREAELGRVPDGYKFVDKRANRKWKDGVSEREIQTELRLTRNNMLEDPKLKSPAAIEKLLPKPIKKLLEQFVIKESSGKTLVPLTDSRPEVDSISTSFTKIE